MSLIHTLARRAWHTLRCWHLRVRIAQLQALLRRHDLEAHPDYVERGLVDARLAELRCELCALELQP